jgi:hypothetical protein
MKRDYGSEVWMALFAELSASFSDFSLFQKLTVPRIDKPRVEGRPLVGEDITVGRGTIVLVKRRTGSPLVHGIRAGILGHPAPCYWYA